MVIFALLWVHFLADFMFQSDEMATLKSSSLYWLGGHISFYALFLLPFGVEYAVVNAVLHFFVDLITSKLTAYFWRMEKRHEFFCVIGVDQALHYTCLFGTLGLMNPVWRTSL